MLSARKADIPPTCVFERETVEREEDKEGCGGDTEKHGA